MTPATAGGPGLEAAGEIVAAPEGSRFPVGDRVMGHTSIGETLVVLGAAGNSADVIFDPVGGELAARAVRAIGSRET